MAVTPKLKSNIPVEKLKQEEVGAFLLARTLLPKPESCLKDQYQVCIGNQRPGGDTINEYVHADAPNKFFLFNRCKVYGRPGKYKWVCADSDLQLFIHENYYQTLLLIEGLFNS